MNLRLLTLWVIDLFLSVKHFYIEKTSLGILINIAVLSAFVTKPVGY